MPKKFKGENSKAAEAKAKKAAAKAAEDERKQKELEDEMWRDDDKHVMRKQQRKDDKEKKRQEQLEKKREKEKLLEEEMTTLKSMKPQPAAKVTRAEIDAHKEMQAAQTAAARQDKNDLVTDQPLEENVNKLMVEGDEARNIDEAISVLSIGDPSSEKHPEKRVKAAYAVYEERNLPVLKAENPNMRLSQLKQMLKKDWMKSPENPMNQRFTAYNTKR